MFITTFKITGPITNIDTREGYSLITVQTRDYNKKEYNIQMLAKDVSGVSEGDFVAVLGEVHASNSRDDRTFINMNASKITLLKPSGKKESEEPAGDEDIPF